MQGYTKEDAFDLPVLFQGKERVLAARLVQMGYTYKIYVMVEEQEIIFEPDEERNFRAIIDPEKPHVHLAPEWFKAIGESLEQHLR